MAHFVAVVGQALGICVCVFRTQKKISCEAFVKGQYTGDDTETLRVGGSLGFSLVLGSSLSFFCRPRLVFRPSWPPGPAPGGPAPFQSLCTSVGVFLLTRAGAAAWGSPDLPGGAGAGAAWPDSGRVGRFA